MESGAVRHNFEMGLPKDYPSQIWFNLVQCFREDLNVIFYQNMPNLHNWYKSAERKISQKKKEIYIFSNSSHLEWRAELSDTILKWDYPSQIWFNLVQRFQRRRFKLKQQWTIEEISIFSNSSHIEWRAELSDTILKGTHPPGTIPARFGLIWFSGFIGEDLNVKVYDIRRTPSDGGSNSLPGAPVGSASIQSPHHTQTV